MLNELRNHWPEYLMEATGLGVFMISAGVCGTLLGAPAWGAAVVSDPLLSRLCMGMLMGCTAVAIIYSPIGKRSGAHMNPAVTVSYWILGKIKAWDAIGYITAQIAGGVTGVYIVLAIFGEDFASAPVRFVATVPGKGGPAAAFLAETVISFLLMTSVLMLSNSRKFAPYAGVAAGAIVTLAITFESPYSGMSMNTARSFASAFPSGLWESFWIYCTAPFLGMSTAAVFHQLRNRRVYCAKLSHGVSGRCIFCCDYHDLTENQRD